MDVSILSELNTVWTAVALAFTGLSGAFFLGRKFGRWSLAELKQALLQANRDLAARDQRLAAIESEMRSRVSEPTDVPSTFPPESVQVWLRAIDTDNVRLAEARSKLPVLLIANLKGGVAKTMIAANLAAYFATREKYSSAQSKPNKRVLLIDLDYQGSLSRMVLASMGDVGSLHPNTRADTLFTKGIADIDALQLRVPPTQALPGLSFYPATYGLDDFETREQFAWLNSKSSDDVRFRLLKRLRSPEFVEQFDLVIIDTGPRLTTGSVGAIVAATHLLIPTSPDSRAIEAAELFLRRINTMKHGARDASAPAKLCPRLKVVGVLGTLTGGTAGQMDLQKAAKERLVSAVTNDDELRELINPSQVFLKASLPRSHPIQSEAELKIPYLASTSIRRIFNEIGAEVEQRMTQ